MAKLKLRTTVDVTHADANNPLKGGSTTGKVTLVVGNWAMTYNADADAYRIEVQFGYFDESDNLLPYPVKSADGVYRDLNDANGADTVKTASQSINAGLGTFDNSPDRMAAEVKAFAITKVMSDFGVESSEVEEI